jgi:hypothetical protein
LARVNNHLESHRGCLLLATVQNGPRMVSNGCYTRANACQADRFWFRPQTPQSAAPLLPRPTNPGPCCTAGHPYRCTSGPGGVFTGKKPARLFDEDDLAGDRLEGGAEMLHGLDRQCHVARRVDLDAAVRLASPSKPAADFAAAKIVSRVPRFRPAPHSASQIVERRPGAVAFGAPEHLGAFPTITLAMRILSAALMRTAAQGCSVPKPTFLLRHICPSGYVGLVFFEKPPFGSVNLYYCRAPAGTRRG